MSKIEELKRTSRHAHVFMKPNLDEDASKKWKSKKVYKSLKIYDGKTLENLSYKNKKVYNNFTLCKLILIFSKLKTLFNSFENW